MAMARNQLLYKIHPSRTGSPKASLNGTHRRGLGWVEAPGEAAEAIEAFGPSAPSAIVERPVTEEVPRVCKTEMLFPSSRQA